MDRHVFDAYNAQRKIAGLELFANPRNAASGSLKLLDTSLVAKRKLNFFAHSLGYCRGYTFVSHGEYLQLIRQSGFQNVSVPKDREIVLPNQLLIQYLSLAELRELKKTDFGIFSITVYGEKP